MKGENGNLIGPREVGLGIPLSNAGQVHMLTLLNLQES